MCDHEFNFFCLQMLGLPALRVRRSLESYLEEDAGHGDLSLKSCPTAYGEKIDARLVVKSETVVAGLPLARELFQLVCGANDIEWKSGVDEGEQVSSGTIVLEMRGPSGGLLIAERAALNLLSRLSGIATYTRRVAEALNAASAHPPRLLETRKTTPGLKVFEKYATRVGGAHNHRLGLDSGAMIKENHVRAAAAAGVTFSDLIVQTRKNLPLLAGLEVEVTSLDELQTALQAGADVVMLDNFQLADMVQAVDMRNEQAPRTRLELSGNLDRQAPESLANCGVDDISMGALIHQATWSDYSLQFKKADPT